MKSKLTKYTNDLKAQKWTEIVVNCNESGMSKTAWCRENNVSIKSFFYWQHKLRMKMIESSPTAKAAEIVQINLQEETIIQEPVTSTEVIRIRKNDVTVELPMTEAVIDVSAHLSCHLEVNVLCQGRDSILSTELEKQTDTPSTEVSISI